MTELNSVLHEYTFEANYTEPVTPGARSWTSRRRTSS